MSDKRVREVDPGENEQPSMLADDSCEDPDDFFEAIANRGKLRDDDIQALPPGDDEFLDAIFAEGEDNSTQTLPEQGTEEEKIEDSTAGEPIEEPTIHEEAPPSPKEQSPPKSPPKQRSPAPSPPIRATPLPPVIPRSAPTTDVPKPAAPTPAPAPAAPIDPVAAYAERRNREEMEKEKEEAEKRELLTRFFEFEENGIPCPKRFTLKSDLAEMRYEFKKLDDEFNRKQSIKMWKEGIKLITNILEVANKRFDPIGWKANDFSDNLNLKLGEADWALREMHKKYFRRGGKPSPELFILFAIGGTALDTHKANVKKEEQRQQKLAQQQPQQHWGGMPYPPPQGYPYPYPPMMWNPAMRPPGGMPPKGPGQMPHGQPGQQQGPRPSVQMPQPGQMPPQQRQQQPQQQQPQQQQQMPARPVVIQGQHGIPGTAPPQNNRRQMPVVDNSPVATAIPAPMPSPSFDHPQPPAPRRRMIPPPSESGIDALGDITQIMGSMGGSAEAPATRRTSNYGPDAVDDDSEEDQNLVDVSSSPRRTSARRPVEPPRDASPGGVRFDDATGEILFD